MDWVKDFIFQNFALLFIVICLIIHAIYSFRLHPKISSYSILIGTCTLILAVSNTLENYGKYIVDPTFTLVFSVIGYVLRPICIYLFILLTINTKNYSLLLLAAIPLLINTTIYFLSFSDTLGPYIIQFLVEDGEIHFSGGFLRYTSHIVSLGYLMWFIYLSLSMLTFKRITRGVITLACSVVVIGAAIIESFFNPNGNIYILNTVAGMSSLVYYLYLVIEYNELDHVSGLYNKERYFHDIDMSEGKVTGVAIFKYQLPAANNENEIKIKNRMIETASSNMIKSLKRTMVVYSIEDDKIILLTKSNAEDLEEVISKYKKRMAESNIRFSTTFAFKTHEKEPIREIVREAEKMATIKSKLD